MTVLLITEVPNLDCDYPRTSFLTELAEWWIRRNSIMGKNTKARDNDGSGESTPPKLTKISDNGASSSKAVTPAAVNTGEQRGEMLTVLTGISTILQKGFENLNSKVADVNKGLSNLENNMVNRFDDLVTDQVDEESMEDGAAGGDDVVADPPPPPRDNKRKRQEDHDLSDGELEEIQSEVLNEASNALDEDDSVGPPVKDFVAAFVKKAFSKPLKGDSVKKFKDKFPAPSNIACLDVPRANEPIYIKLSATAKNKDRAIQDNQAIFMRVVTALVKVTDVLSEHEKEGQWVKDTMKMSTDAITLAASLKNDWLKARRDDIKPSLPNDFKRLASVDVPLDAKNLFGDDLEGSIKSVENTNKIANKMDGGKKPYVVNNNNNNKPNNQQKSSYNNKYNGKKKRFYSNKNNNKDRNNRKDDDKKDFHKKGSRN